MTTTDVPRRKPAARASKLVMAGGAVGLSFGLVGAMVAASQGAQSAEAITPAAVVQRVVVRQPTASPAQIIVMLPEDATAIELPAVTQPPSIPDQPAAPAPGVPAKAPVSESSGS